MARRIASDLLKAEIDVWFDDGKSWWAIPSLSEFNRVLMKPNILDVSPTALAFHVQRLNNRPRKRLGYQTPHEVFHQQLNVAPHM